MLKKVKTTLNEPEELNITEAGLGMEKLASVGTQANITTQPKASK